MQTHLTPILLTALFVIAPPHRLKADVKNVALGVNEAT